MQLRIFLYKPGDLIRQALSDYLESLGHEVAVINYPQTCLQYHSPDNICSSIKVCADMIIVGTDCPPGEGLTMLEKRVSSGCRGSKINAIVCDGLSAEEKLLAEKVGCKVFNEPLDLEAVGGWLDEVVKNVDQRRELSPFTIGSTAA